jgi:hypothetical protein
MVEKVDQEVNQVKGYLQAVLGMSDKLIDYKLLIPESLHHTLRSTGEFFNQDVTPTLLPHEVTEFKQTNIIYLDLIKKRMVYNLLEVAQL